MVAINLDILPQKISLVLMFFLFISTLTLQASRLGKIRVWCQFWCCPGPDRMSEMQDRTRVKTRFFRVRFGLESGTFRVRVLIRASKPACDNFNFFFFNFFFHFSNNANFKKENNQINSFNLKL